MTETGQGTGEQPGRWLPPAMAAEALGISERTVRRHVLAGKLSAERDGHRVKVLVALPDGGALLATASGMGRAQAALLLATEALQEALVAERARSERLEARLREIEEQRLQLALRLADLQREASHVASVLAAASPAAGRADGPRRDVQRPA